MTPEAPRLLERNTHHFPNPSPILHHIQPHYLHRAGRGLQDSTEDHEKCGLPRTVRSQNYHYLTLVDGEVQAPKSISLPIPLRQVERFHCVQAEEELRLRGER